MSNVTSGRSNGVWLVYDFHPIHEITGEPYHVKNDLDWGYLPRHDEFESQQFSVAKIAKSLGDLCPNYEFHFEHMLKHEPDYVRVVKTAEGTLLRQVIDHKTKSRVVS